MGMVMMWMFHALNCVLFRVRRVTRAIIVYLRQVCNLTAQRGTPACQADT
jgi:hypothetical protein